VLDTRRRAAYRTRPDAVAELVHYCVYVEQGRSGKTGARRRPLFEQMKRDPMGRKFDLLLVRKVSRLGRDMREVVTTVTTPVRAALRDAIGIDLPKSGPPEGRETHRDSCGRVSYNC
jgi:hypothetical protein